MKINQIVYDSENKEFVKITNGIPIVEGQPEIRPTEGIALRLLGQNEADKKPVIAWTYRKLTAERLSPASRDMAWFEHIIVHSMGRI